MAGNRGGRNSAAATPAGGLVRPAFSSRREQTSRWGRCLGGLSCFGSRKRWNRVVPSSRITDGAALAAGHGNGPQTPTPSTSATLTSSLLAPPSSPASSFAHSARSPSSCFLSTISAASLEDNPSFAAGPYAGETQLVSPPVFSTFTTEPSTAPFTPPPELAHLTTPSSPDVPYAQFLSFVSHGYFFEEEEGARSFSLSASSLDQAEHEGRDEELKLGEGGSRDAEELEASYRASFGFSADELPVAHGAANENSDPADDASSFSMSPFPCGEPYTAMDRTSMFLLHPPFPQQHRGLRVRGHGGEGGGGRRGSYYLSLSDAEVEYQRTRSWREERRIFLHGYC